MRKFNNDYNNNNNNNNNNDNNNNNNNNGIYSNHNIFAQGAHFRKNDIE